MRYYVGRRLLSTVPVMLGVVTLAFVFMRVLPGDPVAVLGAQAGASAERMAELRAEYGLDQPLWLQYLTFVLDVFRGELGRSLFTGQPVSQIVAQQAPPTLALSSVALFLALGMGLLLGIGAAVRRGGWLDRLCMGFSVIGVSVPITLSGLAMILVFSLVLRWLPASGQGSLRHLVMPATVIGVASAGSIARLVRTQLIDVMDEDFINVARAKGLSERVLLFRHALRNALIPVVTIAGLQFGFMLGGAVATESVFARQGMGRTLVDAILYQDYPVVQGIVIVNAALYSAINMVVDIAYGYLDPRIYRE